MADPTPTPTPPSPAPTSTARALHSHAVGYTGALVALAALLLPVLLLVGNPSFVDALLWNHDPQVRADHFHMLVTTLVTTLVAGVVGVVGANVGKGPLSPHTDDTTPI